MKCFIIVLIKYQVKKDVWDAIKIWEDKKILLSIKNQRWPTFLENMNTLDMLFKNFENNEYIIFYF